jgi:hypothetical protein
VALRELFSILKVNNNPKKQWTNGSGWGMDVAMHDVVLTSTRAVVQAINYFFVTADEVTTLDNEQWINAHVYVMKDWRRFSILPTLECVEVSVTDTLD